MQFCYWSAAKVLLYWAHSQREVALWANCNKVTQSFSFVFCFFVFCFLFFVFLFFCFLFCLVCEISKTKPLSEKKWILSLKIIFSRRKKENDLNLDYRKLQFSELKPRMPKKSLRLKKILYILSQTKDWTFGGWEVRFFLILSSCKKGMTPFSIWKVSSKFIIFLTL